MRRARVLVLLAVAALAAGPGGAATLEVTATRSGAPVADLVVALSPLAPGPAPPRAAPPPRATIDQIARQFVPRVTVLQAGTVVAFPNSDRIRHQVYSFSPAKVFNLKLYAGTEAPPVTFDRPGLVVLGCNIHDAMIAYVAVVDTPWFARTGADGIARLSAPPGRYRVRLWHPDLATPLPVREVALEESGHTLRVEPTLAPSTGTLVAFPE